jgi:hypothetical protein
MTQLAWLMINHYHVYTFPGIFLSHDNPQERNDLDQAVSEQYFGAADKILTLIQGSADDHFKFLNPFLASTVWMAAAVQLVSQEFGQVGGASKRLTQSKFELLWMTYRQMVEMWNITTAMQQNLDLIASRLRQYRRVIAEDGSGASYNQQSIEINNGVEHSVNQERISLNRKLLNSVMVCN